MVESQWGVSLRSYKLEEEVNSPEWRAQCRHYRYILRGFQGKPRRYKTRAGCEKEFARLVQKGLPEDLFEVTRWMVFGFSGKSKGPKMARRDMTKKQFDAAIARYGIQPSFSGYYEIRSDPYGRGTLAVYARNGGASYREMLAYLLKERARDKEIA